MNSAGNTGPVESIRRPPARPCDRHDHVPLLVTLTARSHRASRRKGGSSRVRRRCPSTPRTCRSSTLAAHAPRDWAASTAVIPCICVGIAAPPNACQAPRLKLLHPGTGQNRESRTHGPIAPVKVTGRRTGQRAAGASLNITPPDFGLRPVSLQRQTSCLPVTQSPGVASHVLEPGFDQRHVERDARMTIDARAIHHHILVGSQ